MKLDLTFPIRTKHTLFPKTNKELYEIIESEIDKNGNDCSLNHIDVSKIHDMSELFLYSTFNGDISEWDVSSVENMEGMFAYSKFNGDISDWNVLKITDMCCMFTNSKFNQNISRWNVDNVVEHKNMFKDCLLENNKVHQPKFNKDISQWQLNVICKKVLNHIGMFNGCSII